MMIEKSNEIRKLLSQNLKKHREKLGISQEKLAEIAGISTMMIKDIEGCRSWVSDKTLFRLGNALKTDIFRLFMPENIFNKEINRTLKNDIDTISDNIRQDIEKSLNKLIRLWK